MPISVHAHTNLPHLGLDASKRTYISRQAILFNKMLPELLRQYAGNWVLFEDNRVLDADEDYHALIERVRKALGDKVVLIKRVEPVSINL